MDVLIWDLRYSRGPKLRVHGLFRHTGETILIVEAAEAVLIGQLLNRRRYSQSKISPIARVWEAESSRRQKPEFCPRPGTGPARPIG